MKGNVKNLRKKNKIYIKFVFGVKSYILHGYPTHFIYIYLHIRHKQKKCLTINPFCAMMWVVGA